MMPALLRVVAMLAGLALGTAACATGADERNPMDMPHPTLWHVIEILGDQPSLAPERVALVLPVTLVELYRNAYFSFHEGGRVDLADRIDIDKVELRVSLTDEARGLVLLRLGGACLPIEEVRARFPDLSLSNQPRGRSLDEEAGYATARPWGRLSFGFKERNPRCLATVVVDRLGG